jgi:hypothetical protein
MPRNSGQPHFLKSSIFPAKSAVIENLFKVLTPCIRLDTIRA